MARDFWVIFKHKARVTKTRKLVDGRCWLFLSGRPSVQISRLASATQPQDVNTKCCVCRYICTNIGVVFFKAPRRQDHQAVRPVSISAFSWLYVFFSVKFRFGFFVCANLDTTNNFFLLAIWYQILSCSWFQFAFVYFLANFLGFNRLDRNVVVFFTSLFVGHTLQHSYTGRFIYSIICNWIKGDRIGGLHFVLYV